MQYGKAIKLFFQDDNWVSNAFVGFVMLLIPVVGQLAIMGWHCEIAQRLVRDEDKPIPKLEFGDFMTWLERGVAPFVANLLITLPLTMIVSFAMIFVGVAMPFLVRSGNQDLLVILMVLFGVGMLAFSIVVQVLSNAAITRAELTGDLGATLKFQRLLGYLRDTFWHALLTYFVFFFLSFLVTLLGVLALFVGVFVAGVALGVANVSLRVQIYQRYLERGGETINLARQQVPSHPLRQ